nr:Chain D, residue peptide from VSV glycoprotein [synthetic construct]
QIYTDIEMNR